jgi:hypothetical protein
VKDEPKLEVNGKRISPPVVRGYARIERRWEKGDTIELRLPMPVRRIVAHEAVQADRGKVALQRGPLVFCLEGHDNDAAVLSLVISDDAKLKTKHRPDLLGGVTVITGKARTAKRTLEGDVVLTREQPFTAIPYYAWAHRGRSPMTVWPARMPEAAYPEPADTLAYTSRTTASFVHKSLDAIKDQIVPANSADASAGQLDFWPHKNTTEWLRFEWDRKERVSRVQVYWFDDSDHGGCRVPQSWRVLYRDAAGAFQPVSTTDSYGTQKDAFNTVTFDAVETDAIKIEIVLDEKWSAGVQEVVIE